MSHLLAFVKLATYLELVLGEESAISRWLKETITVLKAQRNRWYRAVERYGQARELAPVAADLVLGFLIAEYRYNNFRHAPFDTLPWLEDRNSGMTFKIGDKPARNEMALSNFLVSNPASQAVLRAVVGEPVLSDGTEQSQFGMAYKESLRLFLGAPQDRGDE